VAFAASTTVSTSTSVGSTSVSATAATSAWHSFHLAWKAYADGLRSIDLSYRSSVDSARSAYLIARSTATTPAERQAALATFQAAVAADLNTKVAAIIAAGDPPAPPAGYNGTAWVTSFQAIHVAFRASVTAADTAYAQAIASATTSWQRQQARLTLEASLGSALVVRANALEALGPPPADPGQASS
jgi:hypothetical protein